MCEAKTRKEMTTSNAAIESRRFGVELEVEGISTDWARRELRLSTGWKVTSDGSLNPADVRAWGLPPGTAELRPELPRSLSE